MTGIKSVFISSDPPVPPTGGGTRAFHFLTAVTSVTKCSLFVLFPIAIDKLPAEVLSKCSSAYSTKKEFAVLHGRVSLMLHYARLLFAPWSMRRKDVILAAGYFATNSEKCRGVKAIFYSVLTHALYAYVSLLYRLISPPPARTLERYDQYVELKSQINEELSDAEVVWLDFSFLFPFFKNLKTLLPQLKIICNAHNIEYLYLERMQEVARTNIERKWYRLQARVMKIAELEGFAQCNLVITCSENDRHEILKNLPGCNVAVLPNGVDLGYFKPAPNLTTEPSILFTGTMSYDPNKDAVEYFLDKIFPGIKKEVPTCKFIIAGANAVNVFRHYLNDPGIEISSSPKDMRPFYNKAWVVVVPLRLGSGTRLKILEAMAMEKPVVSTEIGAEGIQAVDEHELLLASDEKTFIKNVIRLLSDGQLSARIKGEAKKLVVENYSWEQIIKNASTAVHNVCH